MRFVQLTDLLNGRVLWVRADTIRDVCYVGSADLTDKTIDADVTFVTTGTGYGYCVVEKPETVLNLLDATIVRPA